MKIQTLTFCHNFDLKFVALYRKLLLKLTNWKNFLEFRHVLCFWFLFFSSQNKLCITVALFKIGCCNSVESVKKWSNSQQFFIEKLCFQIIQIYPINFEGVALGRRKKFREVNNRTLPIKNYSGSKVFIKIQHRGYKDKIHLKRFPSNVSSNFARLIGKSRARERNWRL